MTTFTLLYIMVGCLFTLMILSTGKLDKFLEKGMISAIGVAIVGLFLYPIPIIMGIISYSRQKSH